MGGVKCPPFLKLQTGIKNNFQGKHVLQLLLRIQFPGVGSTSTAKESPCSTPTRFTLFHRSRNAAKAPWNNGTSQDILQQSRTTLTSTPSSSTIVRILDPKQKLSCEAVLSCYLAGS